MIRVEDRGRRRILTLDRPDKRNALTSEMLERLIAEVRRAADDTGPTCLILTGNGPVFSAGADLEAARAGLATSPLWEELSAGLAESPLLTVAALNGTAAGGALGMVFACDLRTAAPAATIFYPVMERGYAPQPSDPGRLAALAGRGVAARLFLAGERFVAADIPGLVDRLAEDPLSAAFDLTAHAAAAERSHVAAVKAALPWT